MNYLIASLAVLTFAYALWAASHALHFFFFSISPCGSAREFRKIKREIKEGTATFTYVGTLYTTCIFRYSEGNITTHLDPTVGFTGINTYTSNIPSSGDINMARLSARLHCWAQSRAGQKLSNYKNK